MVWYIQAAKGYFNPRSLAGATFVLPKPNYHYKFQSTLPRGSDSTIVQIWKAQCLFQSTLPRGSDKIYSLLAFAGYRFQSTLPRGSDPWCYRRAVAGVEFQSTLPRGSDPFCSRSNFNLSLFQSTLPRGSDRRLLPDPDVHGDFNPRSLAGATHTGQKM